MKKAAKEFIKTVMADERLRSRIDALAAPKDENERDELMRMEILPLAKELGFELTLEDFTGSEVGEMEDDELKAVAGGECTCFISGDGSGTNKSGGCYNAHGFNTYLDYECPCMFTGTGNSPNTDPNCQCLLYGSGKDW